MSRCGDCERAVRWHTEQHSARSRPYWLGECTAENVSDFWTMLGMRPQVMPDAGIACPQFQAKKPADPSGEK